MNEKDMKELLFERYDKYMSQQLDSKNKDTADMRLDKMTEILDILNFVGMIEEEEYNKLLKETISAFYLASSRVDRKKETTDER